MIVIGGGAQVAQVALGAVSEADRHNLRGERMSIDAIALVGEENIAAAVRAVADLPRARCLVLVGAIMGGADHRRRPRAARARHAGHRAHMVGSVTHAADLVVSDPVQAGTMAVMTIADTAQFDLGRQRGSNFDHAALPDHARTVTTNDWPMLTLAVTVALAVIAAVWAAKNRPTRRPVLPYRHVAGAAIVALLGWEVIVNLPGAMLGYLALTAGLGDVDGVEIDQAFVVAQVVFAIGAVFAVVGVLQRRVWGVVLAVGLAVARLAMAIAVVAQMIAMFGDAQIIGEFDYLLIVATTIALQTVPPIAAIVLLAWPSARREAAPADPVETPEVVAARDRVPAP